MSLDQLKGQLPDYAKDTKLNLSGLTRDSVLDAQKLYGTLVASALATRNADVIQAVVAESTPHLSAEALASAKGAASIMAMNNIYYRFVHLSSNDVYKTMPAKLRMNIIGKPGVDKADFELWALAVSAINGCGMCIDAHEVELRKAGLTSEQIQAAVRIASVLHAVAATLDGETALASGFAEAAA